MDYESTDDDDNVVQPAGNIISIAVAVLGIVLGAAGLYFGFNANKRLNSIDTSIQDSATGKAEVKESIGVLNARIVEQENQMQEQAKVISRLRVYVSQSEQAIKKLTSELNINRKQIRANAVQVKSATTSLSRPINEVPESSEKPAVQNDVGQIYVIESGDTLGRLANRFGISLQSIIDANPNVNPRRLSIGQKITIPSR